MYKKLSEIAEIKSLSANTELKENDILVSHAGKKIVRITKANLREYQNKTSYFVIYTTPEYVETIYNSLTSKEYEEWFNKNAKGSAMPSINILALKDFEIEL